MKTLIRFLVVSACLATVTSVSAAVETSAKGSPVIQQGLAEKTPAIVMHKATLSAAEQAKYRQLEQAAQPKAEKRAAGEGMDTTTMVIIGVVVVIVIVAVAAGGGGGGGGGGY